MNAELRESAFYREVDAEIAKLRAKLSRLETLLALRGRLSSLQAVADSGDLPTPARIKLISNVVCAKFEVRLQDIISHKRGTRPDEARSIIFYLCYLERFDLREVGQIFARGHQTISYAYRSVKDRISVDSRFAEVVKSIEKALILPTVPTEAHSRSNTITVTHKAA